MKLIGVRYEICDIDTGEMLLDMRRRTSITNTGIQGIEFVRERFHDLVQSDRNVSLCVTCFDSRYNLDDIENVFVRNKHIEGIF